MHSRLPLHTRKGRGRTNRCTSAPHSQPLNMAPYTVSPCFFPYPAHLYLVVQALEQLQQQLAHDELGGDAVGQQLVQLAADLGECMRAGCHSLVHVWVSFG